jgi:alpha-beta hydrolase superfamily lysophospholipase
VSAPPPTSSPPSRNCSAFALLATACWLNLPRARSGASRSAVRAHGPPLDNWEISAGAGLTCLWQTWFSSAGSPRRKVLQTPFILLGHSMGSFASQQYVLNEQRNRWPDPLRSGALDGVAQLAASAPPGTNILNAPFEPARTTFDWLSRDNAVVDAFINDAWATAVKPPRQGIKPPWQHASRYPRPTVPVPSTAKQPIQ